MVPVHFRKYRETINLKLLSMKIQKKTLPKSISSKLWATFLARSRLIVSAGQGERFVLIIGCHSELPSQDCTFCFLKHSLISPFCQLQGLLNTVLRYLTMLFTSAQNSNQRVLKDTNIDLFHVIQYKASCIKDQMPPPLPSSIHWSVSCCSQFHLFSQNSGLSAKYYGIKVGAVPFYPSASSTATLFYCQNYIGPKKVYTIILSLFLLLHTCCVIFYKLLL